VQRSVLDTGKSNDLSLVRPRFRFDEPFTQNWCHRRQSDGALESHVSLTDRTVVQPTPISSAEMNLPKPDMQKTFDVDFQHHSVWKTRNRLGLGYRTRRRPTACFSSRSIPSEAAEALYSAFNPGMKSLQYRLADIRLPSSNTILYRFRVRPNIRLAWLRLARNTSGNQPSRRIRQPSRQEDFRKLELAPIARPESLPDVQVEAIRNSTPSNCTIMRSAIARN